MQACAPRQVCAALPMRDRDDGHEPVLPSSRNAAHAALRYGPSSSQADTTAQPSDPATARAQLLKRLRSHVTTVSPALRQRAAGPRGDTSRLLRLLLKLIAGVGTCAVAHDHHRRAHMFRPGCDHSMLML